MTPKFSERTREHEAAHVRHTDLQILDALLRLEELLKAHVEEEAPYDGRDAADLITNVSPMKTPFSAGGLITWNTEPEDTDPEEKPKRAKKGPTTLGSTKLEK